MCKKYIEANNKNYENNFESFVCKVCVKLVKPLNNGGKLSSNRIAFDDNSIKLISLAMKPISSIPFPIERIDNI